MESPDTTATTSGRTSVSSTVRERKARKMLLPASCARNAGPPPPDGPPCAHTAIPMMTGIAASTASRIRLRIRSRISRSSEPSSRNQPASGLGTRPAVPGPAVPGPAVAGVAARPAPVASAADIEALTGQFHEQVLQAWLGGVQPGDRDACVHQLGVDPFRLMLA